MNVKLNKLSLGLAASMVLFAALPAHAAINKYGCIYVVDPFDKIVKDPYGNCIRTPYWTAAKNIPECGGVAAVEPPPAAGSIETITLGADAFFDFDRYDLKPAGRARLDKLVVDLRRAKSVTDIRIVGHTDSKGTEEYNMRLGQRRADTVASYLAAKGVPKSIISTRSEGESNPVAPNTLPNGKDNPAGRALNRRVVITVTAAEKVISQ
ncbi:MAG: OmpA family protein [Candidatus Competibacteraceae bacterium]|uniref:Outer membrane protein A n=1 Tax=Candidatus Contendobacter odensis Run_B_J11 TaxID=1400861 RepID=A0A7U7GBK6_9GAMM|nr:OmpA family protein [Candidatus Contendobacter odensis]MBK8536427.1 OmpA family protein [Candidatus Competibacteraceae bacterium]MBK8753205.1 OmpA family protein [Candidatus Competibacteraceae bacterium]CDH44768.1 putative Outer membrane protein A [Candidatus Contendobacter odensis Run_B_J11]